MLFRPSLFVLCVSFASLAAAEPYKQGVFHPQATPGKTIKLIQESYEDECLELCAGDDQCKGFADRPDGCALLDGVSDNGKGPGAHVLVTVDPEIERGKRRAELALLHPDYLARADRLILEAPMVFDGSYRDVAGGFHAQLAAGEVDAVAPGLRAMAATVQRSADGREMARKAMAAAEDARLSDKRQIREWLRDKAVVFAVIAYLRALDDVDRSEAWKVLAESLAAAGNFADASEAGRAALALSADDGFRAAVEAWESQTPEGGQQATDGRALVETIDNAQLVCDNAASCSLSFFIDENQPNQTAARLVIERRAGPGSAPTVTLVVAVYDGVAALLQASEALEPGQVRLSSGDGDFFAGLLWQSWADGDELRVELPPGQVAGLLRALVASDRLTVSKDGKPLASVGLAGARALLARIDALQGRSGSETALVDHKQGARPQPLRPAALPWISAPEYYAKPAESKVPKPVVEAWLSACEGDGELTEEGQPDRAAEGYLLVPGRTVWMIQCSRGAYSASHFLFLYDQDGVRQIAHEQIDATGVISLSTDEMSDPAIRFALDDAAEGSDETEGSDKARLLPGPLVLRSYERGRGIGDCGSVSDYVFDGQALKLRAKQEMQLCRGQTRDWPFSYRAEVKIDTAAAAESPTVAATPWPLTDETLSIAFRDCIESVAGEEEPMRACVRDEHTLWDKRLNDAYKQLKTQLATGIDGAARPGQVDRLKAAQRAWIGSRDSGCKLEGAMHGGINAAYWQDFCLLKETAIRAGFLEKMIEGGN